MHTNLLLSADVHHGCCFLQVLVKTVHWQKVDVGEEDKRSLHLLQGCIAQIVHRIELLQQGEKM